jgi:hypothetical protein
VANGNLAGIKGLIPLAKNTSNYLHSLFANVTSTYNTGWMVGDTKGVFLSDTDATDLVAGNVFTNSDFSTGDETGWTVPASYLSDGSVDFSVVGEVTITEQAGADRYIQQVAVGSKAGDALKITRTVSATNVTGNAQARIAYGAGTTPYINLSPSYNAGTFVDYVIAQNNEQAITIHLSAANAYATVTSFEVEIADSDRSIYRNPLAVNGTITRSPVATGAELVAYSGFSASNYLEQPYNSDLDFGTGDFSIMGWMPNFTGVGNSTGFVGRRIDDITATGRFLPRLNNDDTITLYTDSGNIQLSTPIPVGDVFLAFVRRSGVLEYYINGRITQLTAMIDTLTSPDAIFNVGYPNAGWSAFSGSLALWRISATAPSAVQLAKIYEDELHLFRDNALAVLSDDSVTALSHDPITDLLYVGGASGMTTIAGITPVSRDTTAVSTFISVVDGMEIKQ